VVLMADKRTFNIPIDAWRDLVDGKTVRVGLVETTATEIELPKGLTHEALGRALEAMNKWEWEDEQDPVALIVKIYLALQSRDAEPTSPA
jgi:hypothetical protein